MAKRRPLVAPDQLSEELKKSTGKGLGAFFTPAPPAEDQPEPEIVLEPEATSEKQAEEPDGQQPYPAENKQAIRQESNITSNITILQFAGVDIDQLREPAYKAQTFRLSEREIEWVRDISHQLSKEFRRGKISQADILRVSLKLFENALATNKADVLKILEAIK